MKNIKKWQLAAAALLLAVIGTVGITASAATQETAISQDQIKVDYVNETITVTTTDDEIVYYTESYTKDVTKWSACEVREFKQADGSVTNAAVFDISWVADNKTVRIYLCGDKNKKVVNADITWEEDFGVEFIGTLLTTDITEAETWQRVYEKYPNFSEDTGYFIFTIEENGRDMSYFPNESLDSIQWRKGNTGVWREYKELDLKEMNIRGISLEFRVVASNVAGAEAKASSTAKVTVAKLASEPGVTVNPNTMTVDIKNGMEFSFDKEEWFMVPTYNKKFGAEKYLVTEAERASAIETIYTKERLSNLLIQEILKTKKNTFTTNTPMDKATLEGIFGADIATEEGIVLYVRDISTERKAASKITKVVIPYALEDMAEASDAHIKFSHGESKTNTGGIVVENESIYKYQVGVITPEDELYSIVQGYDLEGDTSKFDLDLSDIKWTSVKEGKMMKISNKKVPEGSYLVYRMAGEEGNLPSTYLLYGPMMYDHITYAGIGSATVMSGQTLTAVPSTNFQADEDGNYSGITIKWQSSLDKYAENWSDISTGSTLLLNDVMANHYIRVVIIDSYENEKISDPVGPVKPAPASTAGAE